MTHEISDVEKYNFTAGDELFLDTNVWLFINGMQNFSDSRVPIYSSAFHRILEAQSRIYIDILIVSEFINAYAKQKWRLAGKSKVKFKTFRDSPAFKSIAQEIVEDVKRVLSHCSYIESRFEASDVGVLIDEYARGGADFNDLCIKELCRREGLKLITDDGDFSGQEISVLTANRNLLG